MRLWFLCLGAEFRVPGMLFKVPSLGLGVINAVSWFRAEMLGLLHVIGAYFGPRVYEAGDSSLMLCCSVWSHCISMYWCYVLVQVHAEFNIFTGSRSTFVKGWWRCITVTNQNYYCRTQFSNTFWFRNMLTPDPLVKSCPAQTNRYPRRLYIAWRPQGIRSARVNIFRVLFYLQVALANTKLTKFWANSFDNTLAFLSLILASTCTWQNATCPWTSIIPSSSEMWLVAGDWYVVALPES